MAITVTGKNYTQISGCESTSDGGAWTGVDTPDGDTRKEGTYSLCGTLRASGNNDAVFTPTSSVDMSGTKHLRCWYLCTSGGILNTKAGGGIQIGISDGVNEGFWYMEGRDTYPGGWINLVIDVTKNVDSGTKPTSMNAITSITLRNNQTLGKNVDNVWIDNLCLCDGLIAYGDDGGGYFDLDDLFSADDPATLGIGIIRKISGQYFAAGSFEYGDASGVNGCKFQAKSQILIFEDRPVNANLYNLTIVDNGTGTTEFILGSKSGIAGIEGCTIRVADVTQTPKFDLDASTDTDVDNFKLYGFPATVEGSKVTVAIPPLHDVIKASLVGRKMTAKLEVVGNGHFLVPWEDQALVESSVSMKATLVEGGVTTNKPNVELQILDEEKVRPKSKLEIKTEVKKEIKKEIHPFHRLLEHKDKKDKSKATTMLQIIEGKR